jgi:hypothetical protein
MNIEPLRKLKLNIFRELYRDLKTPIPLINFFIYAVIFWVEDSYIDYRIKRELDESIKDYHQLMDEADQKSSDWQITESESSVPGLPILRATHKSAQKNGDESP